MPAWLLHLPYLLHLPKLPYLPKQLPRAGRQPPNQTHPDMTRLQQAQRRLYDPSPEAGRGRDDSDTQGPTCLIGTDGSVRALVLELARPADWPSLWRVWHGVQADLGLPAPAIAVSGGDGMQLWFSLAEALPAPAAWAFLDTLRQRYLGDVRSTRLRLFPDKAAEAQNRAPMPPLVPAQQAGTGLWSAFVAPDLAAVFAEEPWLDMTPNPDGQSALLAALKSISGPDLQHAQALLAPSVRLDRRHEASAGPASAEAPLSSTVASTAQAGPRTGPEDFLLRVMNDESAPLQLRIEAAKALLPYGARP